MIQSFSEWLATTPPSRLVQDVLWMIPFFQALHILAIGVLAASVVLIDVRLVRGSGPLGVAQMGARFMPWIWGAAWTLLITGVVLILGEPKRELLNWIFRTKILLVTAMLILTAITAAKAKSAPAYFEAGGGVTAGRLIGAASLLLLIAIITCGRWIAYAGMPVGG